MLPPTAYPYGGTVLNSDSATYTLCLAGGGENKCIVPPGWPWHNAPGWGTFGLVAAQRR
jgi:hypothetical protein